MIFFHYILRKFLFLFFQKMQKNMLLAISKHFKVEDIHLKDDIKQDSNNYIQVCSNLFPFVPDSSDLMGNNFAGLMSLIPSGSTKSHLGKGRLL